MKILVYGAGVVGSLYATGLQKAGHRVTLLARGQRLADLDRYGLALEKAATRRMTFAAVHTVERLDPEDVYDLAIVPVRKTQLASVLPALASNHRIPSILFLVCNASGPAALVEALGRERVLLGYPGVGGIRRGPIINSAQVFPLRPKTVIGEIDGRPTPRLKEIRKAFRQAGFPTVLSSNVDAWLKTHAAWIGPVAKVLRREDGNRHRLAGRPEAIRLLVRAIRDGFAVLEALDVPLTGPAWIRIQGRLPEAVLIPLWKRILRTETARIGLADYVNAVREEMDGISEDFRALIAKSGIATPAWDILAVPPAFDSPLL